MCVLIKRVMQFKDEGNKAFHEKAYSKACDLYSKAITLSPELTAAYANRAACFISMAHWQEGLNDCNKALEKMPSESLTTKILWRKAVCLRHLHSSRIEWERTVQRGLELDRHNDKLAEESRFVFTRTVKEMPVEYTNQKKTEENKLNQLDYSNNSTVALPSLPITYKGLLQLTRSKSPEIYRFWYERVDPVDIVNAHTKAGIEPDTLDYIYEMCVKTPAEKTKNRAFLDAVSKSNRFATAQLMADEGLYKQAKSSL